MNTLANQLSPSSGDISDLKQDYSPMLNLVETLIGVVPNAHPILDIWPIGFRTYNLLVPNFLNLPVSLLGGGTAATLSQVSAKAFAIDGSKTYLHVFRQAPAAICIERQWTQGAPDTPDRAKAFSDA